MTAIDLHRQIDDVTMENQIHITVYQVQKQDLESWKAEIKDQLQPVQVHYFDKNGKAIYWMINCYVDPVFPKMNWNCEQSLDVFPPRPFSPLNDKFYHDLDFFLPHLRDTANQAPSFNDLPASDYYVLILWNDIFKRPSSSLIHTIQKYNKKQKDVKIHTLYASNHNEYLWTIMDSTNRARVMPLEN